MWPSHTRRESRHHTTAVIRQLLTPAIVAGEMPERGRDPIRGGDHGFQTQADGVQRPSGSMAAGSRRRWSAGRREDRAARTPDRTVGEAAQGASGRARPNTKENRAGRSESGSRTGPLSGRGTCRCSGYQGPTNSAAAAKGEADGGGLYRRGDGLAPTQPG